MKKNLRQIVREALESSAAMTAGTQNVGKVMYCAVVVEDPVEIEKIKKLAGQYVPTGWSIPENYHMTIAHGPLPNFQRNRGDLNKPVQIKITMVGISDKAIALATYGYYSRNEMPHITIAFNPSGGKPSDSKSINNWKKINDISVTGVIRNIGEGNKPITEMDIHSTFTSGSFEGWGGGVTTFPNSAFYDEFGNNIDDIAR